MVNIVVNLCTVNVLRTIEVLFSGGEASVLAKKKLGTLVKGEDDGTRKVMAQATGTTTSNHRHKPH